MINLDGIQHEHREWADTNFPEESLEQATLGVAEEAGELAHAVLKHVQRIRGMEDPDAFREAVKDAAGDIVIYLLSVCDHAGGMSLEDAIVDTWNQVKYRNWQEDRETGGPNAVDSP